MKALLLLSSTLCLVSLVHAQPDTSPSTNKKLPLFGFTRPETLDPTKPLREAIAADDAAKVLELVRAKPELRNSMGWYRGFTDFESYSSPLYQAVETGKLKVARALLETDPKPNFNSNLDDLLFDVALRKGDESWHPLSELLIEFGANVNATLPAQLNKLRVAAFLDVPAQTRQNEQHFLQPEKGDFQTREKWDFLLRHGVNPLSRALTDSSSDKRLIEQAFENNATQALAAMLAFLPVDTQFETDSASNYYRVTGTPLHLALHYRNKAAVQQLLARGANLEFLNSRNETPLAVAAEEVDGLADFLIQAGAKTNEKALLRAIDSASTEERKLARPGNSPSPDSMSSSLLWLAPFLSGVPVEPHSPWVQSPLMRAVQSQKADVLQFVMRSMPPTDDHERLFVAVATNDIASLQTIVRRAPDVVSIPLPNGETPLHAAVRRNQKQQINFLLAHGAKVNAPDEKGQTPLHLAAQHCDADEIRALVSHGANPNARTEDALLPLNYALYSPRLTDAPRVRRVVAALLRSHADPNLAQVQGSWHEPLFDSAVDYGDVDIVRQFLDAGLQFDPKQQWGATPVGRLVSLMWQLPMGSSDWHPRLDVLRYLLKRKVSVSNPAWPTYSLLRMSLPNDRDDFALSRLLLSYGSDINAQDVYGNIRENTALVQVLSNPEAVRFALEHGARPDIPTTDGTSLLTEVCQHFVFGSNASDPSQSDAKNWLQTARLLLETKKAPLTASPTYPPLLEIAMEAKDSTLVELLLEFGVDPNEKNPLGKSPLEIARERDNTWMVALMEAALKKRAAH